MTFAEAVDSFLKLHCEAENKPSTAAETRRIFKAHWLPVFARRLLHDIGTREITAMIDRHRRTAPHETRHAFAVLRKFFNWAKQQRLAERSPCDNLAFNFRLNPRTRVLSDREVVAVFNAAGELGYPYGPIVQLLMLTGQRRGEIAVIRWSYIDPEKRLITLPADLVKNSREHTFAYGDLAAGIFDTIPNQGDMLFPARGFDDRPFSGWSKIKAVLDERSGVNFRLHDLRRTWATHVAELDTHPWVIEAHLNHISGMVSGVAAVYNRHKYLERNAHCRGAVRTEAHKVTPQRGACAVVQRTHGRQPNQSTGSGICDPTARAYNSRILANSIFPYDIRIAFDARAHAIDRRATAQRSASYQGPGHPGCTDGYCVCFDGGTHDCA